MKSTSAILLLLLAVVFTCEYAFAIYTPKDACVPHGIAVCPMIKFKVNVDYLHAGLAAKVTKEIEKFKASKENVNAECLAAHIEYICYKMIPQCKDDSNRHVSQLCGDVCYNRQAICLAHYSKNPLYFWSLCETAQVNPTACKTYKTALADNVFERIIEEMDEEEFDEEEE